MIVVYSECTSTPGELKNVPDHGGITHSNRLGLVAQLAEHWTSKPKIAPSIPTVVRQIFQLDNHKVPVTVKLREQTP